MIASLKRIGDSLEALTISLYEIIVTIDPAILTEIIESTDFIAEAYQLSGEISTDETGAAGD
jgi:hypothetical protein